jgi:hypothetical protein
MKIKKQKLLNFLLHAPEEIDLLELAKFIEVQSNNKLSVELVEDN